MSSATYEKVEDEEETELNENGKTGEADSTENQGDKESTNEQQHQQKQEPEQQPVQQQDADTKGKLCFNMFLPSVLFVDNNDDIVPKLQVSL